MRRIFDIVMIVLLLLICFASVIIGIILYTKQEKEGLLCILIVIAFIPGCAILLPLSKK